MHYINPFNLLSIQADDLSEIGSSTIRRAKKSLLADIELSDKDTVSYKGVEITKADCIKAIDDLDNENKMKLHFIVSKNLELSAFLTNGNVTFLETNYENTYNEPDLLNFISPYFAYQFDKILLSAFQKGNQSIVNLLLKHEDLIKQIDKGASYKSLDFELRKRTDEIDHIKERIKENKAEYIQNGFSRPLDVVLSNFPVEILNSLPKYFQSLINKAAESINYMQLEMGEEYATKLKILDIIRRLNVESITKATYDKNYLIVKERLENKLEQEANAPILKNWASVLEQIRIIAITVDNKSKKAKSCIKTLNLSINVIELNGLPKFGDEIRDQIGYALRGLSISCWNAQKDVDTSLHIINLALKIKVSEEARKKLDVDLKEFLELKKQRDIEGKPIDSAPTLKTINGIGTTIYGKTLYFVFFAIPILPLSRYNCSPTYSGYTFYGKLELHNWQKIWKYGFIIGLIAFICIGIYQSNDVSGGSSSTSYNNSTSTTTETQPYTAGNSTNSTESNSAASQNDELYKSVIMRDGNVPDCSTFNPEYDFKVKNRLLITAEATDAAVKIFDYSTDKCIRFIFINDGTTYAVKNIPQGKYYLKIAYGNNWSIKEGEASCSGHFTSNALYKRDNSIYDFNKVYYPDGRVSTPSYRLKLYTVRSSYSDTTNTSSNSISQTDFNN